jgi:hypothetical protein
VAVNSAPQRSARGREKAAPGSEKALWAANPDLEELFHPIQWQEKHLHDPFIYAYCKRQSCRKSRLKPNVAMAIQIMN